METRIINRSLRTALASFMGSAPREAAGPVRKFTVWDVKPADRALFQVEIDRGPRFTISIREVTDPASDPPQVVGVTICFPLIHSIVEKIGEEIQPLGYLSQTHGHAVCFDAAGGRPILQETEESFERRYQETMPSEIAFYAPDHPGLTLVGQSGTLFEDRFYPIQSRSAETGAPTLCFMAKTGDRTKRIGYAVTPYINIAKLMAGQADYLQPVFEAQDLSYGSNFDLSRARLVGLVGREKGDTAH